MTPPTAKDIAAQRTADRLERKRQLAEQQASQFEDEQSGHELNIARLEAIPTDDRDAGWKAAHDEATAAIATIERAIKVTLEAAETA